MEWGSSRECLNFPPPVKPPESSRAVTPIPCCRPAATVAAGKGVCWEGPRTAIAGAAVGAGTGRERQHSLGDANQPEQTRPHRCPRSPAVPPSSCKSLSRHQHFQSFSEVAFPAPGSSHAFTCHSGYLYIQVQGEKSNNLHTVTETTSTGTAREGSQSPSAKKAPGRPRNPLPCGAPLTSITSFSCQTQTEGRARAGSLTWPSISSSPGWLLAPGCGGPFRAPRA